MITKKSLDDLSQQISSIYKKGVEAADKNNMTYAIDLLKQVVIEEPGFVPAREKLRSLEKRMLALSPVKEFFKLIKVKKIVKLGQLELARKKYKEALKSAEEALALNVKNLSALNLLAEVMHAQNASFVVIETYELAREFYPENPTVLQKLANVYRDTNMGAKELSIRQRLCRMFPDDIAMRSELRSASASAVLEKHDLKTGSSFGKLKDADEAQVLEQKERIVHSIDDVQKLIAKYENDLKSDPHSATIIKKLGELYQKANVHDKALECFQKLEEVTDVFNITLDKAKEKSELTLLKNKINNLIEEQKESSSDEAKLTKEIADLEQQLNNIRKSYALKRVNLYPNDLILHYSLALIYWEIKDIDSAIEHFQISQKNIQYHILSLIYLGRCFIDKKQFDIAIEQLKKAIEQLPTMTEQKMDALYYLGMAYEKLGDSSNAETCFKQIYSAQASYKDVSKRIQKYYG